MPNVTYKSCAVSAERTDRQIIEVQYNFYTMQKLVRLKAIRHSCLPQDIEHDGREITNPRDPPGQRCVYIPPGENHCFLASWLMFLISKSNLSLYSLCYAEASNEFAGPISSSLPPGNTASLSKNVTVVASRWQP